MICVPVTGDIEPPANPYSGPISNMVEEGHQPSRPSRVARNPHVKAYRHHARKLVRFLVESVEAVPQELDELRPSADITSGKEPVIVGKAVGNDEVRLARSCRPIWQLVVVGIRIVE